jgi:hypothetical protein
MKAMLHLITAFSITMYKYPVTINSKVIQSGVTKGFGKCTGKFISMYILYIELL